MNTVELASKILTQLGFSQEPSKELGVDDRRDNIVHLIEEYTHPVKELRDKVEQCTNSDTWNCKYCKKTETCKALKDPRNFGTPKKPAKELTNQEILEISDEIYNKSVGDDIDFARAILRKAQEK